MMPGLEPVGIAWTRWFPWHRGFLAIGLALRMEASDPSMHSLGQPVGPGEIQFTLRGAASAGESYAVECVYRPHRERDVKKTRHLNLLRGWIGSGSRDLVKVQREEFHSVRRPFTATGSDMTFAVSLHDPDGEYAAYQLESVRVVGSVTGTLEFERWFATTPDLDDGFGLKCTATSLRGTLRPSGLAAPPLRGSPPLWPTLRTVDLEFTPVDVPVVRLFEATSKHHWDGWRQSTPQSWPGGRTLVLRKTGEPTVWREHEYYAFPPAGEPRAIRPAPPQDVMPGVQVEVFWPEGESLPFPETRFERDVQVVVAPVSKLPPRMIELLAQSVRLRPGWEPSSLSAREWQDLEASAPEIDLPLSIEMAASDDGRTTLKISRRHAFTEPWICIFGAAYDADRRFVVTSLRVSPERWSGPLPAD